MTEDIDDLVEVAQAGNRKAIDSYRRNKSRDAAISASLDALGVMILLGAAISARPKKHVVELHVYNHD